MFADVIAVICVEKLTYIALEMIAKELIYKLEKHYQNWLFFKVFL